MTWVRSNGYGCKKLCGLPVITFVTTLAMYLFGPINISSIHRQMNMDQVGGYSKALGCNTVLWKTNQLLRCLIDIEECRKLSEQSLLRFGVPNTAWSCAIHLLNQKVAQLDLNLTWHLEMGAGNNTVLLRKRHSADSIFTGAISKIFFDNSTDYIRVGGVDAGLVTFPELALPKFCTTPYALLTISNESLSTKQSHNRFEFLVPTDINKFLWLASRGRFLPCNSSLAEKIKREHPTMYTKEKPVIQDKSINDLAKFRDLLLDINMEPMIFGGTLLGWYRECGIIPHTTDVDLASFASSYSSMLITKLKWDQRFKFFWMLGKPTDSLELSVFAGGVKIDLFFVYHNGTNGQDWVGGMQVPKRRKLRWNYPKIAEVCTGDLLGSLMYVPCNVEGVLSADYGPRWDLPHHSSNFTYLSSHKNLEKKGYWSKSEWRSVYRVRL